MGKVEAGTGDGDPGLVASFAAGLRLIVGWFSVLIGTLNLIVEVDRTVRGVDKPYLLFHFMLIVGGFVLLAVRRVGHGAGGVGAVVAAVVTAAGMAISALPATSTCCLDAFDARHGFPFSFAARGADRWHADALHLVADLLFWGYAGLLAVVAVALVRRLRSPERAMHPRADGLGEPGAPARARAHTHAEPRAHAAAMAPDHAAERPRDGDPGPPAAAGGPTPGTGPVRAEQPADD